MLTLHSNLLKRCPDGFSKYNLIVYTGKQKKLETKEKKS